MAKVILICGKIASGKTEYAKKICAEQRAVNLSCDELMLTVFSDDLGTKHDEVAGKAQRYLYAKALELIAVGTNVVLDWGFWSKTMRSYARNYFESRGIECEMHYIDVCDAVWMKNIELRNRAVEEGKSSAYRVDAGLLMKLGAIFTVPQREEIDVWVDNNWCSIGDGE